jgi:ABC-2 type transport system permease protein
MSPFAGTGPLVRLILRRDRVLMPIWVLLLSVLPLSLTSGTAALYPTEAGRQGYIDNLGSSPLLLMFYGRVPEPSLGGLIFWRAATGMIIVALCAMLTVVRHTRVEEEAGRRELIGSTVVGRHAGLAAALLATWGASLVIGLLVTLGMISQDTGVTGSIAMGLAWASTGILFAAVGAVTAQLSTGAGPARGIGVAVLGLAFGVRAVADTAEPGSALAGVSWLSPLGWIYSVRAYGENRWWIFALIAAATALLAYTALALSARRDVGAGLLPPRLGPATAGGGLRGPFGLAWRLHRGALLSWSVGMAVYGLLVGGVAKTSADLLADNEQLRQVLERMGGTAALGDVFLAGTLGMAGIAVAAYAVAAALRMRGEEAGQRVEPLLATGVSRLGWAASHLAFALGGPAVVLAVTGLAAGVVYGASTGDVAGQTPRVLNGALVQLPAVWLLAGLTVAVFGLLPRLAAAVGWTALGACLLLGQVGALLQLGQPLLDVSPFTHIPRVPGGTVAATPLLILTVLAAALLAAGLAGFRRRDIPAT